MNNERLVMKRRQDISDDEHDWTTKRIKYPTVLSSGLKLSDDPSSTPPFHGGDMRNQLQQAHENIRELRGQLHETRKELESLSQSVKQSRMAGDLEAWSNDQTWRSLEERITDVDSTVKSRVDNLTTTLTTNLIQTIAAAQALITAQVEQQHQILLLQVQRQFQQNAHLFTTMQQQQTNLGTHNDTQKAPN